MSTAPVMRTEVRVSSARSLLVERMGVLLRRVCRVMGAGLAQWKKQAGSQARVANSGLLGAVMGRALAAKNARGRMLSVEERLTLGPKQHMYLVRCGEQRLLVASAGEAALQWMALPGEGASETKASTKRHAATSRKGVRSTRRNEAASSAEGAR